MFSLHCRVTRDEEHKPVVGENEREQIIQEFLNRKREAEANKARVAQDRREPSQAPWAVNDWNYKINPAKNGRFSLFPIKLRIAIISYRGLYGVFSSILVAIFNARFHELATLNYIRRKTMNRSS